MEEKKNHSVCKFPEGKYQPGLFENQEGVEFSNTSVIGNNKKALTFKNPDPNKMFIGIKRLDQHLFDLGIGWVLSFKEFIKSLDFTPFVEKYPGGGNSAYHPALMFGLIMFGIMKGVRSLRNLEELAKDSIACMWICNGIMPDYTTIGRFINLHKEILTNEFFEETTSKILEIVDSSIASVAGDGTVIQAAASSYKSLKLEAAQLAAEKAKKESDDSPDDEKLKKKAEHSKQVSEIAEERAEKRRKNGSDPKRTRVSPTEPEAAIQPLKNKSYAPSYVTSILTTKERIIVGKDVDPTKEISVVKEMIKQAERIGNSKVDETMLDARYFCDEIIEMTEKIDVELLCPDGQSLGSGEWIRKSNKKVLKNQFKYDESSDTLICPEGKILKFEYEYKGNKDNRGYRRYRCHDCEGCAIREKCTKTKKGRIVNRFSIDKKKDALREKMKQPDIREKYKMRKTSSEPVFAETKGIQGFTRFLRMGLKNAKLEHSLNSMGHNIRRMFAIAKRITEVDKRLKAFICLIFLLFIRRFFIFGLSEQKLEPSSY